METGEMIKSTFEWDFSQYLNDMGLKINEDYYRDILYKTFYKTNSKTNCDYLIQINNKKYYIEIAGLMYSEDSYAIENLDKRQKPYRDKMIKKKAMLDDSGVNYLILYGRDMKLGLYKEKTKIFLEIA